MKDGRIISPYVIPGKIYVNVFNKLPLKRNAVGSPVITVQPVANYIYITNAAMEQLGIRFGERIVFFVFGREIYVSKSQVNGCRVIKKGNVGYASTKAFCGFVRKSLHAIKPIKCSFKKTYKEFDGYPMFRLLLPKYMRYILDAVSATKVL